LAHPVQLRKENLGQLDNAVKQLVDFGLRGIEAIHSDHSAVLIEEIFDLARRYNLIATGGSDFHGSSKPHIRLGWAGNRRIPREMFDKLQETVCQR
jgi:predicted metal-dependent phosphoesterase TrpH